MIEKFTPEEIELIEKELAEQRRITKASSTWYRGRCLEPIKAYSMDKFRELKKEVGIESIRDSLFWRVNGGFDMFEKIKANILELCHVEKPSDIPETDVPTAIEYGKKLVDRNFMKIRRRLLNEGDV